MFDQILWDGHLLTWVRGSKHLLRNFFLGTVWVKTSQQLLNRYVEWIWRIYSMTGDQMTHQASCQPLQSERRLGTDQCMCHCHWPSKTNPKASGCGEALAFSQCCFRYWKAVLNERIMPAAAHHNVVRGQTTSRIQQCHLCLGACWGASACVRFTLCFAKYSKWIKSSFDVFPPFWVFIYIFYLLAIYPIFLCIYTG